jgi:hypothetical protein
MLRIGKLFCYVEKFLPAKTTNRYRFYLGCMISMGRAICEGEANEEDVIVYKEADILQKYLPRNYILLAWPYNKCYAGREILFHKAVATEQINTQAIAIHKIKAK